MRFIRRSYLVLIVTGIALSALTSCHSSKTTTRWEDPIYARRGSEKSVPKNSEEKKDTSVPKTAGARGRVIDAACAWIGVPYRYGGNTTGGVDCSGLVCMAFEKGASLKLPRSSREICEFSRPVSREKARAGDLVFFVSKRGGDRVNHVAIYLGDNKIVHSTTSKGVIISNLDDDYWKSHYHSCGSVID